MKILILNWRDIKNPKSGGAEIVTMEHAKTWVRKGHNVTWFTSKFKGSRDTEVTNGVKIIRRGNFISVYLLAPIFYLFNRKKIDLVIDEIHGLPFFTPLYVGKPRIAFIHEVADEIWDYMYPFPFNVIGRTIEPLYFKLYGKEIFWVPCESTIADLEIHRIKRENCRKIICAIKNRVLEKPGKDKEKIPTFVFVSRVVKMKGIEEVISVVKIILQKRDARLWIVGYGEKSYIDSLKKILKNSNVEDKVIFFGRLSEAKKLRLMRKAHLLLHASVKEGWGLVTVEAASQGTPAVVYNVSGLRDSVLNNKTGVVLSKNTPEEMAAEAVKLTFDKKRYRKFQDNGLKWAKRFTWDKASKQSLNLINDVYKKNNK